MIELYVNPVTFFVQIGATIFLFLIVTLFFKRPMQKFMAKRADFIQAQFNKAEQAETEALESKQAAEIKLSEISNAENELLNQAKEEARLLSERQLAESQTEKERLLSEARDEIELARNKMYDSIKAELANLTTQATEALIKKEVDASVHVALFDAFVAEVGGTDA